MLIASALRICYFQYSILGLAPSLDKGVWSEHNAYFDFADVVVAGSVVLK